jgi:NAD-dependent dihydropyrimidine dehydrogenase PreA subunit
MCRYCRLHAEKYGKWYLNPKSYSEELFYKLGLIEKVLRSKKSIREIAMERSIVAPWQGYYASGIHRAVKATRNPATGKLLKPMLNWTLIKTHAGQVVPLEDAEKIADIAHSHVLLPCMCKLAHTGKEDFKCLNFFPALEYHRNNPMGYRTKEVGKEEAKEYLRKFDENGYCHSVFWWFGIPYVICVCNCDIKHCDAMRSRVWLDVRDTYRRSEYVAVVDAKKCTGEPPKCGKCTARCYFGGIKISDGTAYIDASKCFGCGLCRNACEEKAITLVDRNTHEVAGRIW